MAWVGPAIGAAGSILGGLLGSQGGKGGTTTVKPWSGLAPYLTGMYGDAASLASIPNQYYPGQTYVGALPWEQQAYQQQAGYNNMMFGSPTSYLSSYGYGTPTGTPAGTPTGGTGFPTYTPPNAGFTNYGAGGYSPSGGGVSSTSGGYGGGQLNPLNSPYVGEFSARAQQYLDPLGHALNPFGGGEPQHINTTIDPRTGTVNVTGDNGAYRTEMLTNYLRTGEGLNPNHNRILNDVIKQIDQMRAQGYTYNAPSTTPSAPPTSTTQPTGNTLQGLGTTGTAKTTIPPGVSTNSVPGTLQSGSVAGTPFGNVLGSMGAGLSGQDTLGQMAGSLAPAASSALLNNLSQGPASVGRYGFNTSLNPSQYTPQYGQAGGLNATGALNQMLSGQQDYGSAQMQANAGAAPLLNGNFNSLLGQLGQAGSLDATGAIQKNLSGQADYSGLQASIDAANAPILRQFQNEILPGLNTRAQFLNNGTGGIKTLNTVLPEIGQRMSQNAAMLTEAERNRALQAQQQAMGLVTQGGLQQGAQASSQAYGAAGQLGAQNYGAYGNAINNANQNMGTAANLVGQGGLAAYGLGLQGATTQAGLQQALAGQNLATDTTNANLWNQYSQNLLGFGNLAGGLAGDQSVNAARWGSLFPSIAQAGAQPSQDALAYAQYQRGLQESALNDSMNRYNYTQQEPYNRYTWLNSILGGTPYQAQTQSGGSSALGGLGGALAGAQLGGMVATGLGYGGNNASGLSVPTITANPMLYNPQGSQYMWPQL